MSSSEEHTTNITSSITVDDEIQNKVTAECGDNGLCSPNNGIDLSEIPISALRPKSLDILSKRLNPYKLMLSGAVNPGDWRGVLQCTLPDSTDIDVSSKHDPMKEILNIWYNKDKQNATLGRLQSILKNIDRWDVVDDTYEYFGK